MTSEHYYTENSHEAVREAIARAFPVVVELFRLLDESPAALLGGTWDVMLEVRAVYDKEKAECEKTFAGIDWYSNLLPDIGLTCPDCGSELVAQRDAANKDPQSAEAICRACDVKIPAQRLLEYALEKHFAADSYIAVTDGGEQPVHTCPECGVDAYLLTAEETGCAWCGEVLGECSRCSEALTPETVSFDNSRLCAYCDHIMSKDD